MVNLGWLALVSALAATGCAQGGEMMGMPGGVNASRTAAWTALADSLDRDMAAMQSMSGDSMVMWMREHLDRMHRLFQMHDDMMREMMGH